MADEHAREWSVLDSDDDHGAAVRLVQPAFHRVILLRSVDVSDDLVTHELCHVWQMQHRPIRMPLSYLATGYANNQCERQARAAAERTRSGLEDEPVA